MSDSWIEVDPMNEPSESTIRYGTHGLITAYMKGFKARTAFRRVRDELESLNDRQLARRYARYLRTATQLQTRFDFHQGARNCGPHWSTRGDLAQATRRLHIAHRLMRERGLHVPDDAFAWSDVRPSEVLLGNLKLYRRLPAETTERIAELLEETEESLGAYPADPVLQQRQSLLFAHLVHRERTEQAEHGGALTEVSPTQAQVLRTRVEEHLTKKLGYRCTPSEAQQLLESLGVLTRNGTRT